MHSLIEMLKYRRPQGSKTQRKFCQRYLEPVFGKQDSHGNYILIQGESPSICFTAHHDTVHRQGGMQTVTITGDIATTQDKQSNCLGADCTTGIWLILGMIEAGVDGVYVIHASEESGGQGSRALVEDNPAWLDNIQACISFDRYGQESIVTHQMGMRTASDSFAVSLSRALDMPELRPDPGGTFTDSECYAHIVPECTNISVGYLAQHTKSESQDLFFADYLLERLIQCDWQSLTIERNPLDYGFDEWPIYSSGFGGNNGMAELIEIVQENPREIAEYLHSYGIRADDLYQELDLFPFRRAN